MPVFRALLLVLLALPVSADQKIASRWITIADVEDSERLCLYVLHRETGPTARRIITVHESVSVWRDEDGRIHQEYRDEPCDIWVDMDDDGTFEQGEHFRLSASEHACRYTRLPGTLRPEFDGDRLRSIAVRVEEKPARRRDRPTVREWVADLVRSIGIVRDQDQLPGLSAQQKLP